MANDDKSLDLASLKVDPRLWMRIAVQEEEGGALHRVFKGTENPFAKNPEEAIGRLQTLASSGKLYVRENARSGHFRKVQQDGENLKLGDVYEQKMTALASDPVLGLLMWASRGYFKWLGLESLSNWFDKKLKNREALLEQDALYKEEYKSLTKTEKDQLKQRRKQEKEEKKQAKKQQKEADKLAKQKQKEEKKQAKQKQKAERKAEKELKKAEKARQEALKQQKKAEEKFQAARRKLLDIKDKGEMDSPLNDAPMIELGQINMQPDANEQQNEIELKDIDPNAKVDEKDKENDKENEIQNEDLLNNENQQNENQMAPKQMGEGPHIEADKVSINKEHEDQKQQTLHEKLEEEKQELDSVKEWRETLAQSLFSHSEGADLKTKYETLKGESNATMEHLTGAFIGILSLNEPGSEKNQQLMQDMLHGKSLGNENDALVRQGMEAYNRAKDLMQQGNPGEMANMFAKAAKELGQQVSREPNLSTNHIMIGRMLSNVMTVADNSNLRLPLNTDDFNIIRGARTMSQVAQKYYDARQTLGNGEMNLQTDQGREALKDLLTGNAINTMIRTDVPDGNTISVTHRIMANGLWTETNLAQMTNQYAMKGDIAPGQVQKILEQPDGMEAKKLGGRLGSSMVGAAVDVQKGRNLAKQKENVLHQDQPVIGGLYQ